MISYAQNYEDVMLARAFKNVIKGFYIDVGAQDPEYGSVTKHFYDLGWTGINFEPSREYFIRLSEARPLDVNLQEAVGSEVGFASFFEVPGTGLSTLSSEIAEEYSQHSVKKISVKVTTLDKVCSDNCVGEIHFLKIDVEGAEDRVLDGLSLDIWRPWIIVIESTLPNSSIPHYEHWESRLVSRGYRYVYFDGLNRYYVSEEKKELSRFFEVPPNVFDEFEMFGQVRSESRLKDALDNVQHHLDVVDRLGAQVKNQVDVVEHHVNLLSSQQSDIKRLQSEIERLQSEIEQLNVDSEKLLARLQTAEYARRSTEERLEAQINQSLSYKEELNRIFASRSWKITRPLRWINLRISSRRARLSFLLSNEDMQRVVDAPKLVEAVELSELPEHAVWVARILLRA